MMKILLFVCFFVLFYTALALPADPVDPKAAAVAATPPAGAAAPPAGLPTDNSGLGFFSLVTKSFQKLF
ncbi:unnamed protein product [Pieris brassicae]|uniref:Uncharacterized protein n=1 Tax=Pieris brassicae TaxID=7116 RepID=A0A9P0XFQ6_PIEBR|nr:unnamed protein product [Pieris brassicae]